MTPLASTNGWSLALHGGAGDIRPGVLSLAQEQAYENALNEALSCGEQLLAAGAAALDTVEAVVRALEDNPLFNAGRGAAFTHEGRIELDASIMDGRTLAAGAIAAATTPRNPVTLARAVMEKSGHILLTGLGADAFASVAGVASADTAHFATPVRWESLVAMLRDRGAPAPTEPRFGDEDPLARLVHDEGKRGTVGAVARDRAGNLAAAGSTGGITGKLWGRVGDTAIIGAGVYADNQSAAVACTGTGEHFLRLGVAKRICDLVELDGRRLQAACDEVLREAVPALGGEGGVVAVGRGGDLACSFCTSGMYRAWSSSAGERLIGFYDGLGPSGL